MVKMTEITIFSPCTALAIVAEPVNLKTKVLAVEPEETPLINIVLTASIMLL